MPEGLMGKLENSTPVLGSAFDVPYAIEEIVEKRAVRYATHPLKHSIFHGISNIF
jgi:hypothetical protein